LYSIIAENRTKEEEIPLSTLANDIAQGKVNKVTVDGDSLRFFMIKPESSSKTFERKKRAQRSPRLW
jgi:hypothetical protein